MTHCNYAYNCNTFCTLAPKLTQYVIAIDLLSNTFTLFINFAHLALKLTQNVVAKGVGVEKKYSNKLS